MTDPLYERLANALSDSYRLQRELGGGGMSRVFLATDRGLDRDVVVKTLPTETLSTDATERFKREIRTAARLQHPNIVPLLSSGEADGIPYYTMPWVDGASLRERLRRGPIAVPEAVAILRDMARALSAAHDRGIVHRDIKPENVLLSSGSALITDFGVARALSQATGVGEGTFRTATGISVGTPAYMAPEQFAADPSVDHRADLYAWGIVAFEVLTGHHPFEGATGSALLRAHIDTTPARVDRILPEIPSSIAGLVARCLEKNPGDRPASAQQLVDALEMQVTPTAMAAAPRTRRRRVIALAALPILALLALGLFWRRDAIVAGDDRMIAIAPFRVGGAAPAVHYLREGLPDLMTPQLQSIPGVSAPSMRVMLEQWRRAAGAVEQDLPDDRALRVAANTGAAQLIIGEIVGTENRVTVNAQLIRIRDGRVLAPARVEGPADSAAALAARMVATLLSLRGGSTMDVVRSVVSANPEAITPFLVGEQAYRRGRYMEAGQAYARAYEQDTTFALAALRIEVANGWTVEAPIPGPWLDRAWRHRERLRGSDAVLVQALAGADYPAPRPARQYERELWLAAEQANSAELWYHAADVLFHRYTSSGNTNLMSRALEGFRRAEALDSSFALALEHQPAILSILGDVPGAIDARNRQRMLDSTGDFFAVTGFMFAAATQPPDSVVALIRQVELTEHPGMFFANAMTSDMPAGIPLEARPKLLEAFLHATAKVRPQLHVNPSLVLEDHSYWLNVGQPRPFQVAPSPDSALTVNVLNVIAGTVWDGDSAAAARSAAELERWAAAPRDSAVRLLRSVAHFALGLSALERGDTASVERARTALRALRAPPDAPWLLTTPRIHEKLLAAHLAVARRAPGVRSQLEELDSLLIDSNVHRNLVMNLGNLLVSRLWEDAGDDQRAWDAVHRTHVHIGAAGFASARLRAKARLAERLGRREDAIEALRIFVMARSDAAAPFRREVAAARETLARLERESAGR